jgi:hypothetical protein
MFRRLLALTCALAVVGALSWGANAAPISGSFGVDVVFYPFPLEDTLKIALVNVKFEADLILTLSISGVDITSTTVFTFRGVEFQSFVISATVGALTIKDTMVFSPTLFEFEELRDQFGQLAWCVNFSAPNPPGNLNVAGNHANCDFPDLTNPAHYFGGVYAHIDDTIFGRVSFADIFTGGVHPVVQNLVLARWIDVTLGNGLGNPVRFRKKIADLSLNIAGLVLNVKAMFANVSLSPTGFSLRSGLVLSMEGKTVSGVGVRGELWLGAKQGLECFGECKPLERFFNAKVTGGAFNNVEEEKLFLTNVVIAGIRNDLRAEFHFDLDQCKIDQVDNDNDGWFGEDPANGINDDGPGGPTDEDGVDVRNPLCFLQLTQSGTIAPWRLSFQTTWNFNGALTLISNNTTLLLKAGDMSVAATFIFWESVQNSFTAGLTNFVTTFDPPGLRVTSNVTFCSNPVLCGRTRPGPSGPNVYIPFDLPAVLSHTLSFTGAVGPLNVAASAIFSGGLFGEFAELDVDLSVTVGAMTFTSSTILLTDVLGGQAFSLLVKF